jgi:hypothetical protein
MQMTPSAVKAALMTVPEKFKTAISFELQDVTNLHLVTIITILFQLN